MLGDGWVGCEDSQGYAGCWLTKSYGNIRNKDSFRGGGGVGGGGGGGGGWWIVWRHRSSFLSLINFFRSFGDSYCQLFRPMGRIRFAYLCLTANIDISIFTRYFYIDIRGLGGLSIPRLLFWRYSAHATSYDTSYDASYETISKNISIYINIYQYISIYIKCVYSVSKDSNDTLEDTAVMCFQHPTSITNHKYPSRIFQKNQSINQEIGKRKTMLFLLAWNWIHLLGYSLSCNLLNCVVIFAFLIAVSFPFLFRRLS